MNFHEQSQKWLKDNENRCRLVRIDAWIIKLCAITCSYWRLMSMIVTGNISNCFFFSGDLNSVKYVWSRSGC